MIVKVITFDNIYYLNSPFPRKITILTNLMINLHIHNNIHKLDTHNKAHKRNNQLNTHNNAHQLTNSNNPHKHRMSSQLSQA
jgi:hypothetical protein